MYERNDGFEFFFTIIKMHPTTFESFIKMRSEKIALRKYFSIIFSAFRDEEMGAKLSLESKKVTAPLRADNNSYFSLFCF